MSNIPGGISIDILSDKDIGRFCSNAVIEAKTDGCWIWSGSKDKDGYGRFGIKRKTYRAHRVSFAIYKGSVARGINVLHHCDNPPCVNPNHIFVGTNRDNSMDMVAKKRQAAGNRHGFKTHPESIPRGDRHFARKNPERMARGEAVNTAVLTADDVLAIRDEYTPRMMSFTKLASKYGCSHQNIREIIHRRTWRHV